MNPNVDPNTDDAATREPISRAAIKGPYSAKFGAVHHEDAAGFLFTVDPPARAEGVAQEMNAGRLATAMLAVLKDAVADELGDNWKLRAEAIIAKATDGPGHGTGSITDANQASGTTPSPFPERGVE